MRDERKEAVHTPEEKRKQILLTTAWARGKRSCQERRKETTGREQEIFQVRRRKVRPDWEGLYPGLGRGALKQVASDLKKRRKRKNGKARGTMTERKRELL